MTRDVKSDGQGSQPTSSPHQEESASVSEEGALPSARKRAPVQASLRGTKPGRRLDAIQQMAGIGHWRWNTCTGQTTFSDHLHRLLGLDPGQPAAPTYQDLLTCVDPRDRQRVHTQLQQAVGQRENRTITHRVRHPDGSVRWLQTHVEVPLREEEGEEVIEGTCLDVTTRRRVEAQGLEEGDERTGPARALADPRILFAQAAHALRADTGPLVSSTHLLAHGEKAPTRALLEQTRTRAETLLGTLEELLDVCQLASGKAERSLGPVDVRETVEQAINLAFTQAAEQRPTLRYDVMDEVPGEVHMDPERLQGILRDAIGCLLEASNEVHLAVDVASQSRGSPEGTARLFLCLDVHAPDAAISQRLLDAAGGREEEAPAEGRGRVPLTHLVLRETVSFMEGSMEVRPGSPSGTLLRITVPTAPPETTQDRNDPQDPTLWGEADPARRGGLATMGQPGARGARFDLAVLLVQDEGDVREALSGMLETMNVRARCVPSGPRALREMENGGIDVVLVDPGLTGMDGLEIARRIRRELPAIQQPYIAAVTGSMEFDQRARRAIDEDVLPVLDHVLRRPVEQDELAEMLDGLVRPRLL